MVDLDPDYYGGPDDDDRRATPRCQGCGYDLRGLPDGRACPECGFVPGSDPHDSGAYVTKGGVHRRPLVNLLDSGSPGQRQRWVIGLGGAACAAFSTAAVIMLLFLVGMVGSISAQVGAIALAAIALVWTVSSYLMLPATVGRAWPWMQPARIAAMLMQPAWVVLAMIAVTGMQVRFGVILLLGLVALVGTVCVIIVAHYVAEEAEMQATSRRLNLVAWFLPIALPVGIAVASYFPHSYGGLPSGPWGLIAVILTLPVLACVLAVVYLLVQAGTGLLAMRHHARWGQRYVEHAAGRAERIATKRAALERRAKSRIRALPNDDHGEVTLVPEDPV